MMKIRNLIILMLLVVVAKTAEAQTSGTNSPYSRYGWGMMNDESQSFNKGMAGIAYGMRGGQLLNMQNPASYSAIDSLTMLFDVGVTVQVGRMKCGKTAISPKNSTFDYADVAFRFCKGLGFSLGLRPYTTIGYNFNSSQTLDDIDGYGQKTSTSTYLGEGGTHLVYGGLGWAPFKNFSIGANVGYLWGDYNHQVGVTFNESSIQTLSRFYSGTLNTWTLDLGAQYSYKLSKKDELTLGVTGSIGHKMDLQARFINKKSYSTSTVGSDTVNTPDAFQIPWKLGVGLVFNHNRRWMIGVDYSSQMWNNCRFPQLSTVNGKDAYRVSTSYFRDLQRISVGGQYMKNPDGFHYSDKIAYRFGASYSTSYFKINGEDGPKSYKATLGVALPIFTQYNDGHSILNVAVGYEHVAPANKSMIKEDYVRLSLGLMFNATWFNKWKFE